MADSSLSANWLLRIRIGLEIFSGRFGAGFLDAFVAFPRFIWLEIISPLIFRQSLRGVLTDETRRLFYMQGIQPLMAPGNLAMALIVLLAFVLGSQVLVFGLNASVEGMAAKLVAFTLVPLIMALHIVLGGLARWYVAVERAVARGEDRLWKQWGTSLWLMQGGPQIVSAALSSLTLALLSLIILLFLDPLLIGLQQFLLPQVPPLNLSLHITPQLLALSLIKATTICVGVGSWYVFSAASAAKRLPDFNGIVGRTIRPFVGFWLLIELGFWWLLPV